jgi:hypothetical protein
MAADSASAARRPSRWQLQASANWWLGAKVQYGAAAALDPSAAAKTDRFYDDGFNRVDASGNLGDGSATGLPSRTGYFGFSSDSQVDLRAGTLALHQLRVAPGDYGAARNSRRPPGIDLAVRLSLAREDAKRDWGLELGVDWQKLRQTSGAPASANLRLLTDTYQLGGVVPQRAPYAGRFAPLPGDQRIGDVPARTITTVGGTLDGQRSFTSRITMVHLGPWIQLLGQNREPWHRDAQRWSVDARAALALLSQKGEIKLSEQLRTSSLTPAAAVTASGSRSRDDLALLLGLRARRLLNERWSLGATIDYLGGSKFTVPGGARFARIDTTSILRVCAQITYTPAERTKTNP